MIRVTRKTSEAVAPPVQPPICTHRPVLSRGYASFVMATIIPISTNTTIAPCIQIQVGDICRTG